ncbi:hypothetical protein LXM54_26990 [Bacillus sp. Au-Bac7]|nr:hypothetical protein [Bacillus sp. Au-Bac7]
MKKLKICYLMRFILHGIGLMIIQMKLVNEIIQRTINLCMEIYEPSSEVGKSMSSSKINSESDFLNRVKKINKDDYDLLKLQQKED